MELPINKTGDDAAKWTKKRSRRTQYHGSINAISKLPVLPNPAVPSSPSSSVEFSGITTEEVEIELANSLILLSRGGNLKDQAATLMKSHTSTSPPPFIKTEDAEKIEMNTDEAIIPSCQLVEATAQSNGTEYPCKTCYKRFSSFQALGGHRASHKKPKLGGEEQTVQSSTDTGTTSGVILKDVINKSKDEMKANSLAAKNQTVNTAGSKERAHVCQICNAEFKSGQALGGHMRRHKPINQGGNASKNKKEKSGIELDLNFPPLEHVDTRVQQRPAVVFPFEGNPPTQLSLGSPALTNCLYG